MLREDELLEFFLAKDVDADLTQIQREKIFGGNRRRLAAPIFRKKGYNLSNLTEKASRQA